MTKSNPLAPFCLALCLFPGSAAWAENSHILLCGGTQVVEAAVQDRDSASPPSFATRWAWRPESSPGMPPVFVAKFAHIDDCKPLNGGAQLLVTSSGDGVALIDRPSGRTVFYAAVSNAHSAEMLPGGILAFAASSGPAGKGNKISFFDSTHSDVEIAAIPLPMAHGVAWDAKDQVLWAIGGGQLLEIRIHVDAAPSERFQVARRIPLPTDDAHDMVLLEPAHKLIVSATAGVYQIDLATLDIQPYAPLAGQQNIKSVTVDPASGRIAYTRADTPAWWTYTVRFLAPDTQVELPDSIYKVRWVP